MTNEEIKKVLVAAVEQALANGLKIAALAYGVNCCASSFYAIKRKVCPLGAFLLNKPVIYYSPAYNVAELLGVGLDWVSGFTSGFDGGSVLGQNRESVRLGKWFREQYISNV